ncbi:MAG: aryl-sulfate sulfotransferase, partial [Planctomycetota bacterium]
EPLIDNGSTLILCHKNMEDSRISEHPLLDDTVIEVTWEGKIIWEWACSEHFDEMGFSETSKNAMYRNPNIHPVGEGLGDWMHANSMSVLGPNKWFNQGDDRFFPGNIILSGRETNIIAIVDKRTGKIVWQIGPDYNGSSELRKLGWIIGQHHVHMIPKGLPGDGNILLFDNGGFAGYGAPNPSSPTGVRSARRDHSRVLELNPMTLEVVWRYSAVEAGFPPGLASYKFYSAFTGSVQRLPNGNTLIAEGLDGRVIEVTPDHDIVWEYISPYFDKKRNHNMVYRAYRVPYQWIPQIEKPDEVPVPRLDSRKLRVSDFSGKVKPVITKLKRGGRAVPNPQACALPERSDSE